MQIIKWLRNFKDQLFDPITNNENLLNNRKNHQVLTDILKENFLLKYVRNALILPE